MKTTLLYIIFCCCFGVSITNGQIYWDSVSTPTSNSLRKLVFADKLNGWAVGDSGTIIHTTDGGQSWILQNSGINSEIFNVTFPDKNNGWAISTTDSFNTIILNTSDGGNTWITTLYTENDVLSTIYFTDSLTGWAGGYYGSLLFTTDGGNNWNNAITDTLSGFSVIDLVFADKYNGFACGGVFDYNGILWKTTDGGRNWTGKSISADPIQKLLIIDSLNIEGIGGDFEFGTGYAKTTDGGANWNFRNLNIFGIGLNLSFRNNMEGWVPLGGGITGRFIYTRNFGTTWKEYPTPNGYFITDVKFLDSTHGIAVGLDGKILKFKPNYPLNNYIVNINRFSIPVDNSGVIGDINAGGGRYDSNLVLYSGGFYLSGLSNGKLWANASAYGSGFHDYQSGIVGSNPNDPKNIVYIIKSSDPPFSKSWQDWKDAVTLGADFYDGNNDGIYDPVDLNGNGKWDPGEDRPDLLGDITAWCVFNDGVPSGSRKFNDVQPQGIQIQQTLFALKDSVDLQNVFFIRYRIINKGTIAAVLDSVYFGIWNDPDIGNSVDDFLGCDTLDQCGFTYNNGNDIISGANPPALFSGFLQGPVSYIAGLTFIDNNNNGVYDEGIDTPIDTAWDYRGSVLGKTILKGGENLPGTSYIQFQNNYVELNEPNSRFEARNFMLGKNKSGIAPDPCNWPVGIVTGGVNCADVHNNFWYSGDPVLRTGWLNTSPSDQKLLFNTGPFTLSKNRPIDIIVSYSAGRGTDALSSISAGRNIQTSIRNYYHQNFPIPAMVNIKESMPTVFNYNLFQNYPNPFNPITVIRYSLAHESRVKINIYNILGELVKELFNGQQQSGDHDLRFISTGLSSGVYFYSFIASSVEGNEEFRSVKKMVIMK